MPVPAIYFGDTDREWSKRDRRGKGGFGFVDAEFKPRKPPAPGDACWLMMQCPRNGGHCGYIWVGNGFKPVIEGKRTWEWNGNLERPTLVPSINCLCQGPTGERYAGCGWHAHLTDGQWLDG